MPGFSRCHAGGVLRLIGGIMRVYIIEDEALLRELVYSYVSSLPDVEIVGQAEDGNVAMHEILELKPDLVLTDIRLPEVNGMEILFLLKRRCPEIRIVVFTGSVTADKVRLAYEGGADGFIEKGAGLEDFRLAIDAIRKGKRFFGSHVLQMLIEMKGIDVLKALDIQR